MKRIIMIVLSLMILSYSFIHIANNIIADKIRQKLIAIPVPEGVDLIDSVSACGKLYGCGNGMQYTGAILLKTTKAVDAIKRYYITDEFISNEIHTISDSPECIRKKFSNHNSIADQSTYLIVSFTLDREIGNMPNTWIQGILDLDIRGH